MMIVAPPALSLTAELILARMAIPSKKAPSPSILRKSLAALTGRAVSDAEFCQLQEDLASAGLVERKPKGGMMLTEAGRARALEFLGLTQFPPRANWATIQVRCLLPRALGVPALAAERIGSADKLAAFLTAQHYHLPSGGKFSKVVEALVCRELGFPNETSLDGLACAVVGRMIGAEERLAKGNLQTLISCRLTGAKDAKLKSLRSAILQKWADGRPTDHDGQMGDFDLPTFARTVIALARRCPAHSWFGDNKVFIAAVWQASQQEPGFPKLDLTTFKSRLIDANTSGLLQLSRADFVQAMDSKLVAESETKYLTTEFHFVLLS